MFVTDLREKIARLLGEGLTINEVARRLSVAGPTVAYHARRLERDHGPTLPRVPPRPEAARADPATRENVRALLADGVARAEIARRLGVSKSTVSYHARRLGETIDSRCSRRYDWAAIQAYYDEGHSFRECRRMFGFSGASWHAAVRRGLIRPRPAALPIDELCVVDTYRSRHNLKNRLIREGLKEPRCETCGLVEWRGRPLSFALHHVNGDRTDNRLENLELLCANCHSQTPNFAGRRLGARSKNRPRGALSVRWRRLRVVGIAR